MIEHNVHIPHIFHQFLFKKMWDVKCQNEVNLCAAVSVLWELFYSIRIRLSCLHLRFSKLIELLLKVAQKAPAFILIPLKNISIFLQFSRVYIQLFPFSKIQKRCHNVQRVIYHLISFMIYYSSTCWNNMQLHNHFEMKTVF